MDWCMYQCLKHHCLGQARQQQQMAAESPKEREARLLQRRVSDQQRLAAETPEERQAHLLQRRVSDHQ